MIAEMVLGVNLVRLWEKHSVLFGFILIYYINFLFIAFEINYIKNDWGIWHFPNNVIRNLFYNVSDPPNIFKEWDINRSERCNGNFVALNKEFLVANNVILDRSFSSARSAGGEAIQAVLNQNEESEYYNLRRGFFKFRCDKIPVERFDDKHIRSNHLNAWMEASIPISPSHKYLKYTPHGGVTVAVTRYEYVNLYHTMSDWYNTFLVTQYLNVTFADITILFIDAHPAGDLDRVWTTLFSSAIRLGSLPKVTEFASLVWNIIGYKSLFTRFELLDLPLVEEFRDYFLTRHHLSAVDSPLDCRKLNILIVWRRNYVAHPRNPTGSVKRKFANESEMLNTLNTHFAGHNVQGIQLDLYDMQTQLGYIASTDILIGMHGAGMTHVLFLPKHAGVIEILPQFGPTVTEHFGSISKWRHLHYTQYKNNNAVNEGSDFKTRIPPNKLARIVKKMGNNVCTNNIRAKSTSQQEYYKTNNLYSSYELNNIRSQVKRVNFV